MYRYDNAAMTGEPVELSHGNCWKDTYKNAEGVDTDYLYIVDELKLENVQVQPRFYKVVYGSGVELKDPATSQILYEDGDRTAVLYETGRKDVYKRQIPYGLSRSDFTTETSFEITSLSSNRYYFYVIAAYNAYGVAGSVQVGKFDTCFEGNPLEVVSATYNNVDITKKENNRELEQGNTLSVTVTADFIRGGSAVLCRELNGSEVQLSRYNQGSFTLQEDGRYTATLT